MKSKIYDGIAMLIIIVMLLMSHAIIFFWAYANGMKAEHDRIEFTLEKAMKESYDIGVDRGINALEIGRSKQGFRKEEEK